MFFSQLINSAPNQIVHAEPSASAWYQLDGPHASLSVAMNPDGWLELFGTTNSNRFFHQASLIRGFQ